MMIRRTAKNSIGLLRLLLMGLGLLTVQAATTAHADTHSYASERRQIRAGVLVFAGAHTATNPQTPQNTKPNVFYVLDRRTDLKPAGWEFVNPLAPATITGDIYARWLTRSNVEVNPDPAFSNTPAGVDFRVGQPLTKNMGAYWEVNLDNVSTTDLQQFDILLMAYHTLQTQFTTDEREKLRRYVDGGGTIWLEDQGGFDLRTPGFGGGYGGGEFFIDLAFLNSIPAAGFLPVATTPHHPLLNFPYALAATDLAQLGASGITYGTSLLIHHAHQGVNAAYTAPSGIANPRVLVPIITVPTGAGSLPYLSAGDYGAGHIVVSSGGMASGINDWVGGFDVGEGNNSAVLSGEAMLGARPVDLKFAYNLIAWTSSVPTASVNARRTNSSREDIGAQIGPRWATIPPVLQNPPQPPYPSVGSGAVIHKGVVFYVDGKNVLHAYDASPQQDLDNNDNPDDGIPDYIYGAPYDEIWRTDLTTILNITLNTRVSTPTIASIANPNTGVPEDILIVSDSIGDTIAFDAFPTVGGVLAQTSPPIWTISSPDQGDLTVDLTANGATLQVPSPVFSDGVVFTIWEQATPDANHPWHIAAIDPVTGREIFQETKNIGLTVAPSALPNGTLGAGIVAGIPNPVGSLTAGYVRDDSTGALDKMIYVPTRTAMITDAGAGTIQGVWFSTKGEPLEPLALGNNNQVFSPKGQRRLLPWYLTNPPANGVDLRPVVYKTDAAGNITRLQYGGGFTVQYQGGPPSRSIVVMITGAVALGDTFTADYTLDWPADVLPVVAGSGRPTVSEVTQFSQRNLPFTPDPRQNQVNPPPAIRLTGGPTLSPQDYLFVGAGDYPGGDRLYAFHEQFGNVISNPTVPGSALRANTALAWMFYANAPDDDFPGVGTGGVAGRMHNTDPFMPPSSGITIPPVDVYVTDFEQVGSPAYANGIVYVTGFCHLRSNLSGTAQNLPDAMVVMALRANPNTSFTVQQNDGTPYPLPDFNIATPLTIRQPDLINSTALNPLYIELQENVNFTVDRNSSTIQIFDFRSHGRAGNGDAFNTALPIYVASGGTNITGPIVNPQTGYGVMDNVLWWMTVPLAFNNNFYSGLQYPAQWSGSNPGTGSPLGGASGLHPASGPTVVGNTLYFGSTTGQIVSVDIAGANAGGGQLNVYKADGTSRVTAQAAQMSPLGEALQQPIFSPPVATTGIVAVGAAQGLSVFDNQLTLIADNNRLIEVDHAGNASWTTDATQTIRIIQSTGGAGGQTGTLKTTFSRPNMAHRSSLNDYVVADTGNNRVVQIDHGGIVTWELSKLNNDLRFLRDNDPIALNQPTDIQTYTTSGTNSLTFTSPVSNATYTYTPGAGGLWFAIHYIIADSGNFRALEVVDVYDATGNVVVMSGSDGTSPAMLRQVVFVTRSYGEQNKALRYRTIQQFTNLESGVFRTYMVAAVDNARQGADLNPAAANVGTNSDSVKGPGSSLMILKRYPPAGQGADGDTAALINSIVYPDQVGTGILQRQIISNPRWFKEFNVANPLDLTAPSLHYALADANGVYVLKPGTGTLTGEAVVEWSLSNDDYYYMTGRHLNATSIQKVSQSDYDPGTNKFYPHYLITNGYTGLDNIFELFGGNVLDGQVHGEVVEVRSDIYFVLGGGHFNANGGYRSANARLYTVNVRGSLVANPLSAITWMVPNQTLPAAPLVGPLPPPTAVKRKIGNGTGGGTNTGLLEQPTFSDRPF
jgi:hypothetical protein